MSKENVDIDNYCLELELENSILKEQLYIDALTKLPNALLYKKEIKEIKNPKIVIADIDAFKDINEYYGRDIGDYVLQEIARKIKTYADNENMKTYRLGSDQFLLLGDGVLDIEKYERIASELVLLLKTSEIHIPEIEESLVINATIGFCLEEDDSLNKALVAVENAKKREKDFACYMHSMSVKDKYKEKIKYAKIIKYALENDKIIPYYQPILNRDGKILKYETLVRIEKEDGEIVSPFSFMGTSRKVRLYALMTKQMIDKSFKEISKTDKSLSLNLLPRDMIDSDISNFVVDKVREYDIAKQVVFEILEDESIENEKKIESFIKKVKRLGIRIAIDDFGTGYSNFSYLMKLEPDYLKIDGSIIKNIDKDKNSQEIVRAIVSFAKTLHVKTIAEFIHSKDVCDKCFELGIDEFQGYYLGEPKPYLL